MIVIVTPKELNANEYSCCNDDDASLHGAIEGPDDEAAEGPDDGATEGPYDEVPVERDDGAAVGRDDGAAVGRDDGEAVGRDDGAAEGWNNGATEGPDDGATVGPDDGTTEGRHDGAAVGCPTNITSNLAASPQPTLLHHRTPHERIVVNSRRPTTYLLPSIRFHLSICPSCLCPEQQLLLLDHAQQRVSATPLGASASRASGHRSRSQGTRSFFSFQRTHTGTLSSQSRPRR